MRDLNYSRFVTESNRIEGIDRAPSEAEVSETMLFVNLPVVTLEDLVRLVAVVAPHAQLREHDGLDVVVGSHCPPPGGRAVVEDLVVILARVRRGWHPYFAHHAYETLHPFTDGNGRSGRALWLWGMRVWSEATWRQAQSLGFLHCFYYQSLEFSSARNS